jgi:acetate kinase
MLVFTANIGENYASLRVRIAERLAWLGAALDSDANAAGTRYFGAGAGGARQGLISG